MTDEKAKPVDVTELSKDELLRFIGVTLGDVFVHYGMWFTEALHHQGPDLALEMEREVLNRYASLALKRLAPHFGMQMQGDVPKILAEKSREELLFLVSDIAKTWLTGDGLWFQAVEEVRGMDEAKKTNDTCWSHFAKMEAFKIKGFLGIGPNEGLEALERAIKLRIYTVINAHSSSWDPDGSLIFTVTECRVQSARRKKGLDDYPCKSAGIIEYSEFARAVDPRIATECVWCPPDRVPEDAFCRWRFSIAGSHA